MEVHLNPSFIIEKGVGFLTVVVLLLSVGCGGYGRKDLNSTLITITGDTGQGTSSFHNTQQIALPSLSGGIMVYVQGTNGSTFVGAYYLANESSPVIANIPNGNYKVFSIGYELPNMGGNLYCGYGPTREYPLVLTGIDQTVTVTLMSQNASQSFCNDTIFGMLKIIAGKCSAASNQSIGPLGTIPFCAGTLTSQATSTFQSTGAIGIKIYPYEQLLGDTSSTLTPIIYQTQSNETLTGTGIGGCFPLTNGTSTTFSFPTGRDPAASGTQSVPSLPIKTRITALSDCGTTATLPTLYIDFFTPFNLGTNVFTLLNRASVPASQNPSGKFIPDTSNSYLSRLGLIL